MKQKLESRLPGKISITSDMQMTPPYGRKRTRTNKPLESERREWKSWLKPQHSENYNHGISSHYFMAIDGETMETEIDFIFLGSKITAFELWCWRRLLRAPWIARRSYHSILKEISPEYSLEGLCWSWSSNTLATWCEERTHWKRPWRWERLKAGGEGDDRGWDG